MRRRAEGYSPSPVDSLGYAKTSCQHCGNPIEFPTELGGSVVCCPHCNRQTALDSAEVTSPLEPRCLFEGLPGVRIPAARTSVFYRLGLFLAAGMMVLMPLVYLGLVMLVAWGTWHFVRLGWPFLGEGSSRRGGVFYLTPVFVGVALLLFLLVPLFRRRVQPAQALALNPEVEPRLYAFISRVCEMVGAPPPQRIDLDCQLNAAAGFRFGAGWRREFTLTLGLPLVGALDLRQFAGVLAHEFGHFTQGSGMRLSYLIRMTHRWLADLIYGRHAWDEAHEEGLTTGEPNFAVVSKQVTLLHYTEDLGLPSVAAMLMPVQRTAENLYRS